MWTSNIEPPFCKRKVLPSNKTFGPAQQPGSWRPPPSVPSSTPRVFYSTMCYVRCTTTYDEQRDPFDNVQLSGCCFLADWRTSEKKSDNGLSTRNPLRTILAELWQMFRQKILTEFQNKKLFSKTLRQVCPTVPIYFENHSQPNG